MNLEKEDFRMVDDKPRGSYRRQASVLSNKAKRKEKSL